MKKQTKTEYKNMSAQAIGVKLGELKKTIADKQLDKAMDKLTDRKMIWKLRKEVAVLATILGQKKAIEVAERQEGAVTK